MSATPQAISPTENGFTAVNGSRGSPTQSSRASDTMSVRPVTADSQSRAHTAANGENLYHHHHVSPMNGSVKRKRPEEEGDQGDSMLVDEDESDSEEDTPSAVEYGQRSDGNARDTSWGSRPNMDSDEVQLVEALRRDSHMNGHSRPEDGGMAAIAPANHSEYVTTSANVKVDPKKRKRAFTNRTKTGCQTCRKRKKKCDEHKPTCNNCERGGFVCEGYTQKSTFPRAAAPKTQPTPIQSKENYPDHSNMTPSARPNPYPQGPVNMVPTDIRRQGIDDPGMPGRRPMSNEWAQGHPVYSTPGPTSRPTPLSVPTGNPYAGPPSYSTHPAHAERPPSSSTFPGGANNMQYNMHQASLQQNQMHMAQQSLHSLEISRTGPTHRTDTTTDATNERAKMLQGKVYNMLESQLKKDRDQCKTALTAFNTTVVSDAERERQLKSIVMPEMRPPNSPGRLGENVIVEAPFRCDYGYQINLSEHVWIEAGCVITDACEIRICTGAHIGPDVKILGRVEPWNPDHWPKTESGTPKEKRAKGVRIIIGQYVRIAGGAIIAPEWDGSDVQTLDIGNNARILSGAVVTRNVPPNTVWGINESLHNDPAIFRRQTQPMQPMKPDGQNPFTR